MQPGTAPRTDTKAPIFRDFRRKQLNLSFPALRIRARCSHALPL